MQQSDEKNLKILVGKLLKEPTINNLILTLDSLDVRGNFNLLKKVASEAFIIRLCEFVLDALNESATLKQRFSSLRTLGTISLTFLEVRYILSLMFFGCIKRSEENASFYTTETGHPIRQESPSNFTIWYHSSSHSDEDLAKEAYLNSLKSALMDNGAENRLKEISFRVTKCGGNPNWRRNSTEISFPRRVDIKIEGEIGDFEGDSFLVDFANKHPGFGSGKTQEERLFGDYPEMCVLEILMGTDFALDVREAVLVEGCKGYSEKVKSGAKSVLMMDALRFDGLPYSNRVEQLKEANLLRELNKCYAAFAAATSGTLETGHWGCGAFGGDSEIKAIIQLMAAAMAKVDLMIYYAFGDEQFTAEFRAFILEVSQMEVTFSQMISALLTIGHSMRQKMENYQLSYITISDDSLTIFRTLLDQLKE